MTTASTKPAAGAKPNATASWVNTNLYTYTTADRELFEKKVRSFVPPDSFDCHGHWYDLRHLSPGTPDEAFGGPPEVGVDALVNCQKQWMGDRVSSGGLFFPYPRKDIDSRKSNAFLVEQLAKAPSYRGLMMVSPADNPADAEAFLKKHPAIRGFKVYHVYADRPDTFQSDQGEFLPEWAWELADKYGLWITMHMVLSRAIADPRNQRYIREHCLRYPNARYVLAHCARSFNWGHNVEGLDSVKGLDNLFFDNSAVCDPTAYEEIIRRTGTTRLMFGHDFPISEMRGRACSIGDGFFWLYAHNAEWKTWLHGKPELVGIEALLAFQQACRTLGLKDRDIERMFSTNARELLGIRPAPSGEGVQNTYREAKKLIPGGTQLLSKRPEMFAPDQWPAYYEQAIGCEIVDTDGRRFTDFSAGGILACILGYADPDVNAAVVRRVTLGSMATLQTADEVEVARLLVKIHPWARMARFTRSGGEAMSVAVRIARAATGRDKVAICGYHGWHDWYLAANLGGVDDAGKRTLDGHLLPGLEPKGVPRGLAGTALTFRYNQLAELDALLAKHGNELAAIVMETSRAIDPEPGFLEGVRERADKHGIKLVFDEVSIGWRLCLGGAHLKFGVNPDIAVFAKTISNGYAMAAIIGNEKTMSRAQESFISSAYWTEGVGPAASVAAINKMMRIDVPRHIGKIGRLVQQGWADLAKAHGVPLKVGGRPEMASFAFEPANPADAPALATLFTARMLRKGFLAGTYFNPMLAHEERHVKAYLAAADCVFAELAEAIRKGDAVSRIGGPVKHSGFARLT